MKNIQYVIYLDSLGANSSRVKALLNKKRAEKYVKKKNKQPDHFSTYSFIKEIIITPEPKFFISQEVFVNFAQDDYKVCETCNHTKMTSGKKKRTTGVIKDIVINKDGVYYGVDGLKERYPDTTYRIEEKDIFLDKG